MPSGSCVQALWSPALAHNLLGPSVGSAADRKDVPMTYAQRMAETSPSQVPVDANALAECIAACFDCAQACTACADACLAEDDVKMMLRCIRVNLDCADICVATGNVLSRKTAFDPRLA